MRWRIQDNQALLVIPVSTFNFLGFTYPPPTSALTALLTHSDEVSHDDWITARYSMEPEKRSGRRCSPARHRCIRWLHGVLLSQRGRTSTASAQRRVHFL